MTQTFHPNGVSATSTPGSDSVVIVQQSATLKIEKDVLRAIVQQHTLPTDPGRERRDQYVLGVLRNGMFAVLAYDEDGDEYVEMVRTSSPATAKAIRDALTTANGE